MKWVMVVCGVVLALGFTSPAKADFPAEGNAFLGYCAPTSSYREYCLGYIHGLAAGIILGDPNGPLRCVPDSINDEHGLDIAMNYISHYRDRGLHNPSTLVLAAWMQAFPCA
jgi:hypothetical protein